MEVGVRHKQAVRTKKNRPEVAEALEIVKTTVKSHLDWLGYRMV
jgi:predicted ArsR family transcriptional regulator